MPNFYDRLENRTPASRESALFRDLRHILTIAKPRAPSLRAQLRGVDIGRLAKRTDLSSIPLIRRADLLKMQAEAPPFGGLHAMRLGGLKQVFLGASRLVTLEGLAKDWWGMGRALHAAGLRKGMRVLNCFSYDLVPDGHIAASGAEAIGASVIPAGRASIDTKLTAIDRLCPDFFCGHTDELKLLLGDEETPRIDQSGMKLALVTGHSDKGRRSEYRLRGFEVRHVFMLPTLGVVAYESGYAEGMVVGESLIVEIVDPRTGAALEPGAEGELVVSRLNPDCPILRYATGATASILPQPSSCGRTNMRIAVPHTRTPEHVETGGRRINIDDILKIASSHPTLARVSLVMRRSNGADQLHLRVEQHNAEAVPLEHLVETLRTITRLSGTVEVVAPGTMSEDDAVIVDERHLH